MWTYGDVMGLSEEALSSHIGVRLGFLNFTDTLNLIRARLSTAESFIMSCTNGGEWQAYLYSGCRLCLNESHESLQVAAYRAILKYLLFEDGLYELDEMEIGSDDD